MSVVLVPLVRCNCHRLPLINARVSDDELSTTNLSRRMITSHHKLRPTSTRSSFCTLLFKSPKLSRTAVLYYTKLNSCGKMTSAASEILTSRRC